MMMNKAPYSDQGLEEETYDEASEDDTSFYSEALKMVDEAVSCEQASMPGVQQYVSDNVEKSYNENDQTERIDDVDDEESACMISTILVRLSNSAPMNGLYQSPNLLQFQWLHQTPKI
jgi:hypothetical protein